MFAARRYPASKVAAVLGLQECAERLDPLHDEHEIVLAQRKHGIDEIVPLALIAKVDLLKTVSEEGEEVSNTNVHCSNCDPSRPLS